MSLGSSAPPPYLPFEEYRRLLPLAAPTDEQIDSFLRHVWTAHSWYKAGLSPQDISFHFYLDPFLPDDDTNSPGKWAHPPPPLEDQGFFSSGSTAKWNRERFHFLTYRHGDSHAFFLGGEIIHFYVFAAVGAGEDVFSVPEEVELMGQARVSGVIHPRIAWVGIWNTWPKYPKGFEQLDAPLQEKLANRMRAYVGQSNLLEDNPEEFGPLSLLNLLDKPTPRQIEECRHGDEDRIIHEILQEKREEERALMKRTIVRVVDLIYG